MIDFFLTKEQKLEAWCAEQGFFSSHDVNFWGTNNYFDSATRRVRELAQKNNKIRKLPKDEVIFRGFKTKCAMYEWVK